MRKRYRYDDMLDRTEALVGETKLLIEQSRQLIARSRELLKRAGEMPIDRQTQTPVTATPSLIDHKAADTLAKEP